MKAPPSTEHSPRPLDNMWARRGASTGTLQTLASLKGASQSMWALDPPESVKSSVPQIHTIPCQCSIDAQQPSCSSSSWAAGCSEKSADFTAKMCQLWKAVWKQKSSWVIPAWRNASSRLTQLSVNVPKTGAASSLPFPGGHISS